MPKSDTTWATRIGWTTPKRGSMKKKQSEHESEFDAAESDGQDHTDVKEVWFAGCHTGKFLLIIYLLDV